MSLLSKRWIIEILSFTVAAVVIAFLWVPVVMHYRVPETVITDEMIESARKLPSDDLLAELNRLRSYPVDKQDAKEFVADAEKLLAGVLQLPGRPAQKITIPFSAKDLDKGLFIASLGVPRLLLTAYELSGRREFYFTARDIILAWAKYEQRAWLPRGLLWNDHALANRMVVLANFWRFYRNDSDYHPGTARVILELVARTSRLLATPSHFTAATNHGVMQNLALWHYALAFSALPKAAQYRDLALDRMRGVLAFQMNDEGVVLEHSPSYQLGGLIRLRDAMGYLSLLKAPVPDEWALKHDRAKQFYRNLRLPDGSLPVFGDTSSGIDYDARLSAEIADAKFVGDVQSRPETYSLYPVAGYSIWWNGLDKWPDVQHLAQVAVAWSHFPGHAHKHADEMSLWLWARGRRWITNTGDWPSGSAREDAKSWAGSNAPHLIDESAESARQTRLLYSASSHALAFIDLERSGPADYAARRQVLWIKPNIWLVLDHVRNPKGRVSRTVWTTPHNVSLERGSFTNSFLFTVDETKPGPTLSGIFLGPAGTETTTYKGSFSPFAGWEVINNRVMPAPAIVVEQPGANAWSVALWSLGNNGPAARDQFPSSARMGQWENPQDWTLTVASGKGELEIRRQRDRISIQSGGTSVGSETLSLSAGPDVSQRYKQLRADFHEALAKYPQFDDHFDYRVKATKLLLGLLLAQELVLLFVRVMRKPYYITFRILTTGAWSAGGLVLVLFFDYWVDLSSGMNLPL
ncbi:MAG: heparinase II/III domain-containing protein [Candidatus Binatia bacterium]